MIALAPSRTTAPAVSLLSLVDAKAHLRVDGSDEDAVISALIAAAETHLDGYSGQIGKALIAQSWSQSFSAFPAAAGHLRLAVGPLLGAVSVSYVDAGGATATFSDWLAVTDAIGAKIVPADGTSWPATALRPDAVTVTWECGFGAAPTGVPAPIIHAAKLLIGAWYQNREADLAGAARSVAGPVAMLLDPFRSVCP